MTVTRLRGERDRTPVPSRNEATDDICDICGSGDIRWLNCKLICGSCRTILKSCADP